MRHACLYCFITATIQIYNDLPEQQHEMHSTRFKNNTIIRYELYKLHCYKDMSALTISDAHLRYDGFLQFSSLRRWFWTSRRTKHKFVDLRSPHGPRNISGIIYVHSHYIWVSERDRGYRLNNLSGLRMMWMLEYSCDIFTRWLIDP